MWILARASGRARLLHRAVELMRSAPDVANVRSAADWLIQAGTRSGSRFIWEHMAVHGCPSVRGARRLELRNSFEQPNLFQLRGKELS